MKEMKPRFRYFVVSAGVALAALCVVFMPDFARGQGTAYQPGPGKAPVPLVGDFEQIHVLPPGGPRPAHVRRSRRPHRTLVSELWRKNAAGRVSARTLP